MSEHPSVLDLDRFSLDQKDGAISQHVASCPRCRAYLDGLSAPPMPARIAALAERRRRPWLLLLPLVPATAALLFLVRPAARPPLETGETAETREKGPPAIQVYVKRDERVFLLGQAPLRTGDHLRLSVRAPSFRHVAVATLAPDGAVAVLYEGALPAPGAAAPDGLLPPSWRVDEAPGPEVLYLVLGARAAPRPIDRALLQGGGAGVHVTRLVLPKEEGAP